MRTPRNQSKGPGLCRLFLLWALVGVCALSCSLLNRMRADFQELIETFTDPDEGIWNTLEGGPITCNPTTARPGGDLEMKSEYSVRPSGGARTITVRERWAVKREGKVLSTLKEDQKSLERGKYVVSGRMSVPRDAVPGPYTVEHRVEVCPPQEACLFVAQECSFEVVR